MENEGDHISEYAQNRLMEALKPFSKPASHMSPHTLKPIKMPKELKSVMWQTLG